MQHGKLSDTKLESHQSHESGKENDLWIQSQRWNRFKLLKQRADNELRIFLPSLCASHDPQSAVGRFAQHRLFESKLISLVNVFVGPKPNALNLDFLPFDVAFDEIRDELFILSKYNIRVYDLDGIHLRTMCDGKMGHAHRRIHVNSQLGWILVTDCDNNRVVILRSMDGSHVRTIESNQGNIKGMNRAVMHPWIRRHGAETPSDHASDYRIYICDFANHCVHVFSAADDGAYLFQFPANRDHGSHIGSKGSDAGQLRFPCGLAIDSESEELYVADTHNHRVSVFSTDGQLRRHLGAKETFHSPTHVLFHHVTSKIFVNDFHGHRLQIFDREGTCLESVFSAHHVLPDGFCAHRFSGHVAFLDSNLFRINIRAFF